MGSISLIHEDSQIAVLLSWEFYVVGGLVWLGVWSLLAGLEAHDRDNSTIDRIQQRAARNVPRFARRALAAPIWPLSLLWWVVLEPLVALLRFLTKEAQG